jgi:hypothetical protein
MKTAFVKKLREDYIQGTLARTRFGIFFSHCLLSKNVMIELTKLLILLAVYEFKLTHIKGRTQTEGVEEHDAEENIKT